MLRAGLVECDKCFVASSCKNVAQDMGPQSYNSRNIKDCPLCTILQKEGFDFRMKESWEK